MATAPSSLATAELMFGCFKRIRRVVDSELGAHGLSLSRAKLLSELVRGGPMQQGALAQAFGLAPRTVTELVDTLERDGLVERHTDPADRRARLVRLTPAGEEAQARGALIHQQVMDRALRGLSDEQHRQFSTVLHLIAAEVDRIDADRSSVGGVADGLCAP
jgi:DNA-binding MarR family transcriptional regulator